jgi:hypothetical protein
MLDIDFDGELSKEDIKEFLLKVLKMPELEVTQPRLERLFKLFDHFKRGHIHLEDFTRIYESQINIPSKSKSVSMAKSFDFNTNNDIFDWKANARQQIGLLLSKKYPNIRTSFDGN